MKLTPHSLHKILQTDFGNLNWWPMDKKYHETNGSDSRFEVVVGAILTQNTAWSNVEKALANLKSKNMLDLEKIANIDIDSLQKMIRPSGFFKQKADRVKNMALYLQKNYDGELDKFFDKNLNSLRKELLLLNGIGPETADSILLYAGNMPIFVVDAYTKRLCERIPLNTNNSYDEIQQFFEKDLSKKYSKEDLPQVYNELHAQIVILAKNHCKKKPKCNSCPLQKHCMYEKNLLQ